MIRPLTGPSASSSRNAETYFNARATVRSASASLLKGGATAGGDCPLEVGSAVAAGAASDAGGSLREEPAQPNAKQATTLAAQYPRRFMIARQRAAQRWLPGDRLDRRSRCPQPAC